MVQKVEMVRKWSFVKWETYFKHELWTYLNATFPESLNTEHVKSGR